MRKIPWKFFSRTLFFQTAMGLLFFLLSGIAARIYFRSHLFDQLRNQTFNQNGITPGALTAILEGFDLALLIFFVGMMSVLSLFSVIQVKRLVMPIRRILAQARNVLSEDEPLSEWSDLETSIEEIRRELEAKIESLTTEREEQATLMSAISDAIVAVDLEGAPLFYNSRFALLFESKELNVKKRFWEIFKDPEILEAFQDALHEGKSAVVKAVPFDLPTRRFYSVSISPLRKGKESIDKDSIYGVVGIFHDVTDLKRAEQMRIDFVANVSHELRTPLTAIKGYADTLILDSEEGNPLCPEFLEIIARNTDRLMNLINDLLNLSSLESKDNLQKSKLATDELTTRVIKQMRGVFESKRQEVEVRTQAFDVLADSTRIEQVLVNLLDNANKYTPFDGRISVEWESQGSSTVLKIANSGPGIPAEHHSRLFERFYRVDKARSREQGGTGLGLAIVKHIMQRHDGVVSVESAPGQGATFICEFPS